ncbi:unnamed protein product [Mytilus coruscus]|uniref:Uncharacterized protein n=1 Tax=Mytilus coruscus TaxID=42192 RepID=A0A6J8EDW0_MYTCO|nr:unnamed protein product [Mytilus coruscus]
MTEKLGKLLNFTSTQHNRRKNLIENLIRLQNTKGEIKYRIIQLDLNRKTSKSPEKMERQEKQETMDSSPSITEEKPDMNINQNEMDMSIIDAISEERSKTIPFDNVDNVQMNCNSVDIMTDARHACRKNSFNSDITALGQITHKVLSYQHVTKRLERCSQKHELYGTKKLYEDLESKTVNVRCHSHDRNSSISSFIEKDKPNVIDCFDTLHAGKEENNVEDDSILQESDDSENEESDNDI